VFARTNGSDRDVFRPRLFILSRLATITLTVLVFAQLGASPARAAGCHAPERPILGTRRAWGSDRHVEAWAVADALPPPILKRVPCSGELPQVPSAPHETMDGARLLPVEIEAVTRTESLDHGDDLAVRTPHPLRLDRPPR
jgi:hypothetical protein